MYLFIFVHTHFTYTHTHTHTQPHARQPTNTHTHTCRYTYIPARGSIQLRRAAGTHTHTHARPPTHTHTHTHTHIHMHTCSREYSAEVCSWKGVTKVSPTLIDIVNFVKLNFQNRYLVNCFVCSRVKSIKVSRLQKFVHDINILLHNTTVDSENVNYASCSIHPTDYYGVDSLSRID